MTKPLKIAIAGLGYVGLSNAMLLAHLPVHGIKRRASSFNTQRIEQTDNPELA